MSAFAHYVTRSSGYRWRPGLPLGEFHPRRRLRSLCPIQSDGHSNVWFSWNWAESQQRYESSTLPQVCLPTLPLPHKGGLQPPHPDATRSSLHLFTLLLVSGLTRHVKRANLPDSLTHHTRTQARHDDINFIQLTRLQRKDGLRQHTENKMIYKLVLWVYRVFDVEEAADGQISQRKCATSPSVSLCVGQSLCKAEQPQSVFSAQRCSLLVKHRRVQMFR